METETKPTTAPKAAVKSTPKTFVVAPDPTAPQMTFGKDESGTLQKAVDKAAVAGMFEAKAREAREQSEETKLTLGDFDNWLKLAPKEWLPTMMVRIANKCLAEKVFASPGAMAEAIVGASKGKK